VARLIGALPHARVMPPPFGFWPPPRPQASVVPLKKSRLGAGRDKLSREWQDGTQATGAAARE